MFGFFKKEAKKAVNEAPDVILSPAAGTVVELKDVPDPVFAQKMMGDGAAVEPSSGRFTAPVSGELSTVFPTGHAYGITADDGREILVHIGLDTVAMNGEGFTIHKNQGQHVDAGDLVVEADLDKIREAGHPTVTMVLVTSGQPVKEVLKVGQKIKESEPVVKLDL